MSSLRDDCSERGLDLERTIYLSDVVFAIAITLLVVDSQVPDVPTDAVAMALPRRLLGLTPQFSSFAISTVQRVLI